MSIVANLEGDNEPFAYGLFGAQFDEFTDAKKLLVSTLYRLLAASAVQVDHLQDERYGSGEDDTGPTTTVFVASWRRADDYRRWMDSAPVRRFWDELPDDAGVWREVMTVPKSSYTFTASQPVASGAAALFGVKFEDDDGKGSWGANRRRLQRTAAALASPPDDFASDFETSAKVKAEPGKKTVTVPHSFPARIRRGRVKLTEPPNNLLFFRDGQRQPNLSPAEQQSWEEKLRPLARSWFGYLASNRNKHGVMAFEQLIGRYHGEGPAALDVDLDVGVDIKKGAASTLETAQMGYFLDLGHFELAGRSFKDHVTLVRTAIDLYGPGGPHSTDGRLSIFAEHIVVKSTNLDAEYIGCREGTGLMYLADVAGGQ